MKTIWHVGAWADNHGDRALQSSIEKIIRNSNPNVKFVFVNTQRTYFSPQLIEKMNSEADLLIVGGGGLLFHRPMDLSYSGWQFNIKTEDVRRIKIPMVVYGIGYNKFPHDNHAFSDKTWDNVNEVLEHANIFSVRNGGTKCIVQDNTSSAKKIDIVPDPGMFVEANEFDHNILNTVQPKIALNWATDRIEHRFGSKRAGKAALAKTLKVCERLRERYNAKVYIVEHLVPNDLNIYSKKVLHKYVDKYVQSACVLRRNAEFMYPPFDYNVGFLAYLYQQMDVVIGMRGHANILPFGQGTPVIGLGQHQKVRWFLDEVGLGEFSVSTSDADFDKQLESAVDTVFKNKVSIEDTINTSLSKCKQQNDEFVKRVMELI